MAHASSTKQRKGLEIQVNPEKLKSEPEKMLVLHLDLCYLHDAESLSREIKYKPGLGQLEIPRNTTQPHRSKKELSKTVFIPQGI